MYALKSMVKMISGRNGCLIVNAATGELIDFGQEDAHLLKKILSIPREQAINKINKQNVQLLIKELVSKGFLVRTSSKVQQQNFRYYDFDREKSGLNKFSVDRLLLEFTGLCNLNCRFCEQGKEIVGSCLCKKTENSVNQINHSSLIPWIINSNVKSVIILGGDPLVCATNEVLSFLTDLMSFDYKGEVIIHSNCVFLNDNIIKNLSTFPFVKVNIVLFGCTNEFLEEIVSVRNPFGRIMDSLRLLKKYKIPIMGTLFLSSLLLQSSDISEINKKLGIPLAYKVLFDPQYTDLSLMSTRQNRSVNSDYYQLQLFEKTNSCLYGQIAIDAAGNVCPCLSLRSFNFGNILNEEINEILAKGTYKKFWYLHKGEIRKCSLCKYRLHCLDCRALEYTALNDLYGEYYCAEEV